jgi:hypothetical protein
MRLAVLLLLLGCALIAGIAAEYFLIQLERRWRIRNRMGEEALGWLARFNRRRRFALDLLFNPPDQLLKKPLLQSLRNRYLACKAIAVLFGVSYFVALYWKNWSP